VVLAFQFRYKYAHETLGMKDGNAYARRNELKL
jgi:hypothetical protein